MRPLKTRYFVILAHISYNKKAAIAAYFFLLFPAFDNAIAIACFWSLPDLISVLMLDEIVFCDEPFFNGILNP